METLRRHRSVVAILTLFLTLLLVLSLILWIWSQEQREQQEAQRATATKEARREAATEEARRAATTPSVVRMVDGDDWHLPDGLTPDPRSGIYGYSPNGIVDIQNVMITWADLHTGDDEYDWSPIDSALDLGPTVFRLKAGTPSAVPQFIRRRHPEWQTFKNGNGVRELPQWSPGWLDEWRPFIRALGDRYADDPRFIGLQLGITASGEPFLSIPDAENFERIGLTPDVLQDYWSRYHRYTLEAFAPHEWKVFTIAKRVFVGTPYRGNFSPEAYTAAASAGTIPFMQEGMGTRGASEQFGGTWSEWPDWYEYDEHGVLVVHDDTYGPIIYDGHLDAQIENWYGGNKNTAQVETEDDDVLRLAIRLSILQVIATQHSYVWIDGDDLDFVEEDYAGISAYLKHNLGLRPEEAADALLVLGEFTSAPTDKPDAMIATAWPRWLQPLNITATGQGVPVAFPDQNFVGPTQHRGRTVPSALALDVDDRFLPPGGRHTVEAVVTYYDNKARWMLQYHGPNGVVNTPVIAGEDSGTWKSVTLRLPDATFAGRLSNDADLRLVAVSGTPIVEVVRVIKPAELVRSPLPDALNVPIPGAPTSAPMAVISSRGIAAMPGSRRRR